MIESTMALANVGYRSADSTVANVLKAHFSGMQWPNRVDNARRV